MKTIVTPVASFQDPAAFKAQAVPVRDVANPPPETPSQAADLHLVIEEDGTGSFIYKTLDRRTGEVIRQLPREEVVRLKDAPGYSPGDVIDSQG
ncbi:MAG: hypothetical protein ACOY4K_11325 [Pseudomonadota bacterium]